MSGASGLIDAGRICPGTASGLRLGAALRLLTPAATWGMEVHVDQLASVNAVNRPSADLDILLQAVAAGDRRALRTLYDRTSAKLYGICLRVLNDQSEAQDVLQEVYVTAWRKAGIFDPSKSGAVTWLGVLARNRSIDRLRSRRDPGAGIEEAVDVPSDAPSQFDVLEQSEDARRLEECLGELDQRARDMIRSAFFEGASYPELARRENVPLPTMKSWIRRGLISLRGCLER